MWVYREKSFILNTRVRLYKFQKNNPRSLFSKQVQVITTSAS